MAGEIRDFIDGDGVSHKVDYEYLANKPTIPSAVPIASDSVAGKVMVGQGLAIDENGVLSVKAGHDVSGIVFDNGNYLSIDAGGGINIKSNNVLEVDMDYIINQLVAGGYIEGGGT